MPRYDDASFDPPAPVARVTLREPDTGAEVSDVLLLVDTGSDVTLLPRLAVERLGATPLTDERRQVAAFDGSTSFTPVVELDLLFLRRSFRGRYLLIDQEQGILGRNILNHLTLVFDGPQQQWSEWVR